MIIEKEKQKENLTKILIELLYFCTLQLEEFLQFSLIPTSIEIIVPVRIAIAIYLMVFFAIHIFEDMGTRLSNFGSHILKFFVFSTIPCLLSVVFGRICSIALGVSEDMRMTTEYHITPLSAIFTLQNF